MCKSWSKFVVALLALSFFGLLGADEVADRLNEAQKYYAQENYNKAIYFYQSVILLDPRNITAYKQIGDSYFQLKEYEDALENYKKVQWLEANSIDYRLGLTYYCIGEYEQAQRFLLLALAADSGKQNANLYLAKIYDYQKNYGAALKSYQREVKIAPTEQNFVNLARYYRRVGRYDQTIATADSIIAKFPESGEAYLIYAELAELKGFDEKAIDSYRKAAQLGNGKAQLWMERRGYLWREEKSFFDKLKFWAD